MIDTSTNTLATTIAVGRGPGGIAVEPARHTACATKSRDNTLSVINTTTIRPTTIRVGD